MSVKAASILSTLSFIGCGSTTDFAGPQRKSFDAQAVYKNSFVTSQILGGEHELADGGRYEAMTLEMHELPPTVASMQQIERKPFYDLKRQGHDGRHSEEEFDISAAGILDLLVVIDDSRSMREEQKQLGEKLEPLLSAIKETNWQIAVISMSDPCVNSSNLIKRTDLDAAKKFETAVRKPDDREATEQGFPMAIQALQGQCNRLNPWLRAGSTVGVLIVSDEDNCGSHTNERARCNNKYGKNADEMLEYLYQIRATDQARVYGLVKKDASCTGAAGIGTEYLKAVAATGGVSGSICGDFSNTLSEISRNVNRITRHEFKLKATPDLYEFKVTADGVEVPQANAWLVEKDKVTIKPEAFLGKRKVKFTYSHDAKPKFQELPLKGSVAHNSMVVKFNGVLQEASAYQIDSEKREIRFTALPPDDAFVELTWREDVQLLTKFPLTDTSIRENTLEIKVDGRLVAATDYAFKDGKIEFASAPQDLAVITAQYKTEQHKLLKYEHTFAKEVEALEAYDVETGVEVAVAVDAKKLAFPPKEFSVGRKIKVKADFGPKSASYAIELPEQAIQDSLVVTVNGADLGCKVADATEVSPSKDEEGDSDEKASKAKDGGKTTEIALLLSGSNLKITCPAENPDYSVIRVAYKYETDRERVFTVPNSVPLGDPKHPTSWRVFVGGSETVKFKRDGRTITLEEQEIGPAVKVDIEATSWQKVE